MHHDETEKLLATSYQILHVIPRGSSFEVEIVKMIYLKTIIPTSSTPRHILLIIQILLVHWDVMLWVASLLLCIT